MNIKIWTLKLKHKWFMQVQLNLLFSPQANCPTWVFLSLLIFPFRPSAWVIISCSSTKINGHLILSTRDHLLYFPDQGFYDDWSPPCEDIKKSNKIIKVILETMEATFFHTRNKQYSIKRIVTKEMAPIAVENTNTSTLVTQNATLPRTPHLLLYMKYVTS